MIDLFLLTALNGLLVILVPKKIKLGLAIICLGGLLNCTAVVFNNGRMPVSGWTGSPDAFKDGQHSIMTADSRVKFLCDVHGPGRLRFSLGDLALTAGFITILISPIRKKTE